MSLCPAHLQDTIYPLENALTLNSDCTVHLAGCGSQPRSELSMFVLAVNTSLAKAQIPPGFFIRGDEMMYGCLTKSMERMPTMGPKRRCVRQQARQHCCSWLAQPYPSKAVCRCTLPMTCLVDARFHLHTTAGPAHPALTNSRSDSFLLLTHMRTTATSQVLFQSQAFVTRKETLCLHLESKRERKK